MKTNYLHKTLFLIILSLNLQSYSQTQLEMNDDAYHEYSKADKELNETYQKLIEKFQTDTIFIEKLRVAQRIWIQLRDAELDLKYPEREPGYYGSVLPMCKGYYLAYLTKTRTEALKEFLKPYVDGDVCN